METWERNYITKLKPALIEDIECSTQLLTILASQGILSRADVEIVKSRAIKLDQSCSLLDILATRTNGYEILVNALYQTRQTGAVLVLLQGFQDAKIDQPFLRCGVSLYLEELLVKQVMIQGTVTTLQDASRNMSNQDWEEILQCQLDADSYSKLMTSTFTLIENTVPSPLEYYVPRSLSISNGLDPSVFSGLCEDIFVIQFIELNQLTKLAWSLNSNETQVRASGSRRQKAASRKKVTRNLTDVSSNQIDDGATCKFILLQAEHHYDKIALCSPHPVHWIQFQEGKYNLVTSSKGFQGIQKYIKDERTILREAEFIDSIVHTEASSAICISDSPGMGKSVLLAEIARNIRSNFPERLVLFANLPEFVILCQSKHAVDYTQIKDLLVSMVSPNSIGKNFVRKLISLSRHKIEIFFDGFDEILPELLDTGIDILRTILKESVHTRMCVSTRPHMRQLLEDTLSTYAYNIEPFQESDQRDFLVKFWRMNFDSSVLVSKEYLDQFASRCLSKVRICDQERNITGIPLQCRLLAEIHLEDIRLSNANIPSCGGSMIFPPAQTIFEMYRRHIENCFNKIEGNDKESVINYHRYEAWKLLFPEFVEQGKFIQSSEDSQTFRIGLMTLHNQFNHRTFAEYLVAEHLTLFLNNPNDFHKSNWLTAQSEATLVFDTALEIEPHELDIEIFNSNEMQAYKFKNQTVAYFLNEHLKFQEINGDMENFHLLFKNTEFDFTDTIYKATFSALFHDNHEIFKLIRQLLQASNSAVEQIRLAELDWKRLFQIGAQYSNLKLFRDSTEFLETIIGKPVQDLDYDKNEWEELTPLHIAIHRGNYQIFEQLLNAFQDKISQLQYLLHACVVDSYHNPDDIINNKIQIIETLVSLDNNNYLEEDYEYLSQTPVLMKKIHFKIVQCLISKGANIFVEDVDKENLAHNATEYLSASEFKKLIEILIAKEGSILFTSKNKFFHTPVHYLASKLEVSAEALKLISQSAKVAFNTKDVDGNTEFFKAIEGGRSKPFLECMIELGADWKAKNNEKETALHISCNSYNENATRMLIAKGVNRTATDADGWTPLHLVALSWKDNASVIAKILLESGAKVNAVNDNGETPLQIAQSADNEKLVNLMLSYGGKQAGHVVATWKQIKGGIKGYWVNLF